MHGFIRFLVVLLTPFILIVGGGALMGYGIENEHDVLAWTGIAMVGAGVIWGLVVWLFVSMNSW